MSKEFITDLHRYRSNDHELALETFIRALYRHPAFAGIVWYRLGRFLWLRRRNPFYFILLILVRILYPLIRIHSGVELGPSADFGPGLWIGHIGPCNIHPATKAGCNITIHQGVTIGEAKNGVPVLGNDVSIGANAILIGGIKVGSNVIIGAGAVVVKSVPDGAIAVGVPAKAKIRPEFRT